MKYNEAKFNGISFWLKDHDFGRRAKMADNEVLFEDEEQKKEYELQGYDFQLHAYIYGKDVSSKVSALDKAFNAKKTGILELPFTGRVRVKFAEGGFRFRFAEGKKNYVEMELDFIKADESSLQIKIVKISENLSEKLKTTSETALAGFLKEFNGRYVTDKISGLVKQECFNDLAALSEQISSLNAQSLISSSENMISGTFDSLAASAAGIGGTVQSYINLLNGKPKNKYKSYMSIAKMEGIESAGSWSSSPVVAENRQAVEELTRNTAFADLCLVAAEDETLTSKKEIEQAIADIIAVSKELAAKITAKECQTSIFELQNTLVQLLKQSDKMNTRQITNRATLPASVIAHDQNIELERFLKNNAVRHPLFVAGGKVLEV